VYVADERARLDFISCKRVEESNQKQHKIETKIKLSHIATDTKLPIFYGLTDGLTFLTHAPEHKTTLYE